MNIQIWQIASGLGVGAFIAFLFYLVIKQYGQHSGQGFQTTRLGKEATAIIAVLIILIFGGITILALVLYAPKPKEGREGPTTTTPSPTAPPQRSEAPATHTPKSQTDAQSSSEAAKPIATTEIEHIAAVLRERAMSISRDFDTAISTYANVETADTSEAITQLTALRTKFLELHEKHIGAIKEMNLYLTHELAGEISDLLSSAHKIMDTASGNTVGAWHKTVHKRYIKDPPPGSDPEYDSVLADATRLYAATSDRARLWNYPGLPPASTSQDALKLVFERDLPKQRSSQ